MTATAIVQARMGSTRLPGKSLSRLGPTTVLGAVVTRLSRAHSIDKIIIATTQEPVDDALADSPELRDLLVVRGSTNDVLSRFLLAARHCDSSVIVRVTGDCPFIDPTIVDLAVDQLITTNADYVGTDVDGRFPHGLDVEALTTDALQRSDPLAVERSDREHVTPALYRSGQFRVERVVPPLWARRPDIRLTVDEQPDLDFARALIEVEPRALTMGAEDIIATIDGHPELKSLNSSVTHNPSPVEGYRLPQD